MHEMVCHLLTACVAAAGKDSPSEKQANDQNGKVS